MTFHEFVSDDVLAEIRRMFTPAGRLVIVNWTATGIGGNSHPSTNGILLTQPQTSSVTTGSVSSTSSAARRRSCWSPQSSKGILNLVPLAATRSVLGNDRRKTADPHQHSIVLSSQNSNPHGEDIDTVCSIRDDIHRRVVDLFDELSDDS